MTTIVGITHKGKVYLAGDSAISFGGGRIDTSCDPKVWTAGECVFGGAGDVRGIQLARYVLKVPKLPRAQGDAVTMRWLVIDLAAALRAAWSTDMPYLPKTDSTDLLIGARGMLAHVDWDLAVTVPLDGLASLGAGGMPAIASLRSTGHIRRPKERLTRALDRAVAETDATRPPYRYVSA